MNAQSNALLVRPLDTLFYTGPIFGKRFLIQYKMSPGIEWIPIVQILQSCFLSQFEGFVEIIFIKISNEVRGCCRMSRFAPFSVNNRMWKPFSNFNLTNGFERFFREDSQRVLFWTRSLPRQ